MYETVWMRWFRLLFGNTTHAASATLCAYFLGLALGAAWLGRAAGRSPHPLRLYAQIEIAIAATALLVPIGLLGYDRLYPVLYAALADQPALFLTVKLVAALVVMLPCAVGIGGALPPLAAALLGGEGQLGRHGAGLYAANVLGGVVGAAAGGLLLPEWIGVGGTYAVGLTCSVMVGAWAWWLGRGPAIVGVDSPSPAREGRAAAPAVALWIAGVSGFGLLAFEVLLVHALARFFSHTTYSFGLVLVAVLLCLAIGASVVASLQRRFRTDALLRGALLVEAALLLLLPWAIVELGEAFASGSLDGSLAASPLSRGVIAVGAVGVPALLVASLVFPLTFRLAEGGPAGPRLGGLLAVNTLGGIVGSLGASFGMLEAFGLWGSFGVLGLAYAVVAPLLCEGTRGRVAWSVAAVALAAAVASLPESPWRLPAYEPPEGDRILAQVEGAFGLVSVVQRGDDRYIAIDEQYQFGHTGQSALYRRMGRLPLLLHPDPKRVLVIGSATGGLAAAAVEHPVDEIVLVEMVPEVHALAATWFAEHNAGVHGDPRTRLVTEDGRNHLRATRDRHDVIVEDLFIPHRPSASAMYSRDHYLDARDRLTEQGVFCQWLPLYQLSRTQLAIVVATFVEVFPDATLWTPTFRPQPILGLVGFAGPPPSVADLAERGRRRSARGMEAPWLYDPEGLWTFYRGPASRLAATIRAPALHSDARPVFEFVSARTTSTVQRNFTDLDWPRLASRLVEHLPDPDPVFPGHPTDAPRGGEALATLNRLAAAGRGAEVGRASHAVRKALSERLLTYRDESLAVWWPEDGKK